MKSLLCALVALLLIPLLLSADTYDVWTLARVDVPTSADRLFIQSSRINVVNAGPDWVKALLRPKEFKLLSDRGLKVVILTDEMERDRALWRAADAAAEAHAAN